MWSRARANVIWFAGFNHLRSSCASFEAFSLNWSWHRKKLSTAITALWATFSRSPAHSSHQSANNSVGDEQIIRCIVDSDMFAFCKSFRFVLFAYENLWRESNPLLENCFPCPSSASNEERKIYLANGLWVDFHIVFPSHMKWQLRRIANGFLLLHVPTTMPAATDKKRGKKRKRKESSPNISNCSARFQFFRSLLSRSMDSGFFLHAMQIVCQLQR